MSKILACFVECKFQSLSNFTSSVIDNSSRENKRTIESRCTRGLLLQLVSSSRTLFIEEDNHRRRRWSNNAVPGNVAVTIRRCISVGCWRLITRGEGWRNERQERLQRWWQDPRDDGTMECLIESSIWEISDGDFLSRPRRLFHRWKQIHWYSRHANKFYYRDASPVSRRSSKLNSKRN